MCDITRRKRNIIISYLLSHAHSETTREIYENTKSNLGKHQNYYDMFTQLCRLLQFARSIIFCSVQHRLNAHICLSVWFDMNVLWKLKPPPIRSDQEDSHHWYYRCTINYSSKWKIMPVMMTEHMQTKCVSAQQLKSSLIILWLSTYTPMVSSIKC